MHLGLKLMPVVRHRCALKRVLAGTAGRGSAEKRQSC